jgi:hypothetical protein
MPHIARIQSITNRPSGGGDKKGGSVNSMDFPRIPTNILKSKTPKPYLFSATSGSSN